MNEVSQGEAGGQEYVEFIVVDSTAVYDCDSGTPPCIDIRGWIIDDNSGYHGTAGIASGACRFSYDPLWSCVPLGTIIVIYNDADPNVELPGDDTSLSDGNCSIIAPISSNSLFETNATTPGDVACSYPATGWTAGGNWTNIVMANGGDCFRLVDLGGCEVFSLCWDDNNANNLIYFSGGATSGSSATNTVYYFNDGDPTDVSNWTVGCADQPACGIQEQTPGAPNNPANAAYISQFNNGCMPIPPLVASATSVDGCGCTGTASASATGSIPGYTYEWYDDTFASIGQSTANATSLCAGTYNVIVTSSIDCKDTVQVTLNSTGTSVPGTNGTLDTCASLTGSVNLFDYLGGTPDNTGSWSGPSGTTGGFSGTIDLASASAGTYTYNVGTAPCIASADVVVSYTTPPIVTASGTDITCNGLTDGTIDASATGTGSLSYSWDNGLGSGASHTGLADNIYTVTVTDGNGCTNTDAVTITEPAPITATIAPVAVSCNGACDGVATVTPSGGSGSFTYSWDNLTTDATATTQANLCATTYNVIVADATNAACNISASITVTEPTELSSTTSSTNSNCSAADGSVSVNVTGGTILSDYDYEWTDSGSTIVGTTSGLNNLPAGMYYVDITDNNGCSLLDSAEVIDIAPNVTIVEDSTAVTCFGSANGSINLTITSPNSYSVDWTGPNGFTAAATDNLSLLAAGVYDYIFTDINGCQQTGFVTIESPTELMLSLEVDSTSCDAACDGAITASATGGNTPYSFSSDFPGWTNGTADLCVGSYTINVTDNSGCTSSIDTLVDHSDNRPDATILTTDFDYCLNEPAFNLSAQDQGGTWTSNGAGITNTTTGLFSPVSAGVGAEQVIYSFSGVCGDADTVEITIHDIEDASFSMASSICENDGVTPLTPLNNGGIWQGTGVDGSALTFDPLISGAGTHDITYIMPGQCPDTVVHQITVSAQLDPVISGISDACINDGIIQLSASIPGGVWSGVSNSSGLVNTATLGEGTFDIYYTIQSQCGGADTITFTINDLPILDIEVSDTLGCTPLVMNYSDMNASSDNQYLWSLDGDEISTNPSDSYTFSNDGCFELSVTVTDANGCSNSAIYPSLICVEPYPMAYFEYSPENPTTNNYLVDVTNLSTDASGYQWTLAGSDFSTQDLQLNFNDFEPNGYELCLTAVNYLGCSDTYCDTIFLEDEFAIYVPNTFTPNGNGTNETFGPVYSGDHPEEVSFMIFNRWGQLIYEVENLDEFWDGSHFGQPAKEDVYIWKIRYKIPNSAERETLVGHVTLIR
ncbi:T9SS type B sorting domain-containing protein [Parvicella tangerina]|nr:gliding motility-associated C-terminal domain-containing protein [Parvicella tangerina]